MQQKIIFPTVIYKKTLDIDNRNLAAYIVEKSKTTPSVSKTNYGGWQSPPDFIFEESMKDLKTQIADAFAEAAVSFGLKPDRFSVLNGWCNINYKGCWNFPHTHPGSYFSCAYYVSAPHDCQSNIYFEDPRVQRTQIEIFEDFDELNEVNNVSAMIKPQESELLIFPSWLKHFVNPNQSEDVRISVSCNYGHN